MYTDIAAAVMAMLTKIGLDLGVFGKTEPVPAYRRVYRPETAAEAWRRQTAGPDLGNAGCVVYGRPGRTRPGRTIGES